MMTIPRHARHVLASGLIAITVGYGPVPGHVNAVCHGTAGFRVTPSNFQYAQGSEEPRSGVCNGDRWYASRVRRVATRAASYCVIARYTLPDGLVYSNCTTSSVWVNGPVFRSSTGNAPLYFIESSLDDLLIPTSGPWTNYGF